MTVNVLIVDDSALMRDLLTMLLQSDPEIKVVGTAADPYDAREKIKSLNPDVLTLDVEMPRMDGVTFLRNLMRLRPMPVVMISSLIEAGAELTLEALSIGAVDFITKPKFDMAHGIEKSAEEIIAKVKFAATAKVKPYTPTSRVEIAEKNKSIKANSQITFSITEKIIAIAASTGGVEAIQNLLIAFPADASGTLIVQHMPPAYTTSFAKRLDEQCALNLCEAKDGQQVLRGHAYLAPGGRHMECMRDGARFYLKISDGPLVNHFKPSADVLFHSVAKSAGHNAVAAILTGMGYDGAEGMRALRLAGAHTIAQDEKSSVVWGMPAKAIEKRGINIILPLNEIADQIVQFMHGKIVKKPLKKSRNQPLYYRRSI